MRISQRRYILSGNAGKSRPDSHSGGKFAEPGGPSDDHLVELWIHGRSVHAQRAYRADINCFRGKDPLHRVTPADLQQFADSLNGLADSSRYRILSAIKSLVAFGHRIGLSVVKIPSIRRISQLAEVTARMLNQCYMC
jgi:hypothetical protein